MTLATEQHSANKIGLKPYTLWIKDETAEILYKLLEPRGYTKNDLHFMKGVTEIIDIALIKLYEEREKTYHANLVKLQSEDIKTVTKAAHALGDFGDRRAVLPLIDLLENTHHSVIRNAAAVALSDLGDQRAFQPIVAQVQHPKNQGDNGTLVYALRNFDCSTIVPFLVDLVISGDFEVSHEAFLAIETVEKISEEDFQVSRQKIERALLHCDQEKAALLEDLLDIFSEE
jgi:HEAT repeat protein